MKLTKIILDNFRAFPGGRRYELAINKSGNMLLYGENGSGKSSIAVALRELFNPLPSRPTITHWANTFSGKDKNTTAVELEFEPPPAVVWSNSSDSMGDERVRNMAHRCLVIDYRDLLAVTAFSANPGQDLFRVAVQKILAKVEARMEARMSNRNEVTIGDYWASLTAALEDEKRTTKTKQKATDALKTALTAKLPDWQTEIDAALATFRCVPLKVKLSPPQLHYDVKKKKLAGDEFEMELKYNGQPVENPREYLNESTLSAFAISLFLSAARLTAPDSIPGLHLLVLDDILIGLDLSNRLAVLELIKKNFQQWQVILITHNRQWYEAARQFLPDWTQTELYRAVAKDTATGHDYWRPVLHVDRPYLDRAKQHLDDGDLKAAAVYLRTGFEQMLRAFAEKNDLKVKFRSDHREVECSEFWDAVKGFKKPGGGKLVGEKLARAVEVCRSHVLNDVVHFGSTQPCREELLQTHSLLLGLENALFPPVP